jgi:hypothetical protein
VTADLRIKLGDFGLSRHTRDSFYFANSNRIPIRW